MTQIEQGMITVAATGALALLYWGSAMVKHKGNCDKQTLLSVAVNSVGLVAGIFVFIGSFEVMKTSVQNGVWSGVAGVVIVLAMAQDLFKEFKNLFAEQTEPEPREITQREGGG